MSFIDGLKIHIKTDELREHLMQRVAYHSDKADHYAKANKGVRDAQEEDLDALNAYSNNPRQSLSLSERSHRNKMGYFTFMADHLVPDVTYVLDHSDLIELEIMGR